GGVIAAQSKHTSGLTHMAGCLGIYSHHDARLVAVVQLNCTDGFTARAAEVGAAARDIALHIASENPWCIDSRDVELESWNREVISHRDELLELRGEERDDF